MPFLIPRKKITKPKKIKKLSFLRDRGNAREREKDV